MGMLLVLVVSKFLTTSLFCESLWLGELLKLTFLGNYQIEATFLNCQNHLVMA
jgi:hypothetical protein